MTEDYVINVFDKGTEVVDAHFEQLAASADKVSISTDKMSGKVKKTIQVTDEQTGAVRKLVIEDNKLVSATEQVTRSLNQQDSAAKSVTNTLSQTDRAIQTVNRALAGLVTAGAVKSIISQADAWTTYANQLKAVGVEQSKLAKTQSDIADIARRSNTDLSATNELYVALTRNSKQLRASQSDVAKVTETINKAFALQGGSSQSAAAAIKQLNQAFASGTLRGDELNSVIEQAPVLARIAAKEFTGTADGIGRLREMAEKGQVSTDRLFRAIKNASGEIEASFAKSTTTVGQSLTNLQTSITQYIGNTNNATGVTTALAAAINYLAQNLPAIADGVIVLAGAWVTYRIAVAAAGAATAAASALTAASPLGRVVILLGTAAAGFVALTAATADGRKAIGEYVTSTVSGLQTVGKWLVDTAKYFIDLGTSATTAVKNIGSEIEETFTDAVMTVKSWYDSAVNFITVRFPNGVKDALRAVANYFTDTFNSIVSTISGAMDRAIAYVKNVINSIMSAIRSAQSAIANIGGGGNNSNSYGGERAGGGPVSRNKTYLVGENGPELFVASRNGTIIPNGSEAGSSFNMQAGNDNLQSARQLIADGVRDATNELLVSVDKEIKTGVGYLKLIADNTAAAASSAKTTADAVSSSSSSSGFSNINNFGQDTISKSNAISTNVIAASDGHPSSGGGNRGGGGGGNGVPDMGNYPLSYIQRWAKEYANYFNEQRRGLRYKNELEAQYAANRWLRATVPSSAHGDVQEMSNQYKIATQVGANVQFRSGGQFTVPGSTGADSKRVTMDVSPGEQVDVRTRKQVRDEESDGEGGKVVQLTFNVYTPDADSFRRSQKQISRDLMRQLSKDAS